MSFSLGTSPTCRSTGLPSLNRITVGNALDVVLRGSERVVVGVRVWPRGTRPENSPASSSIVGPNAGTDRTKGPKNQPAPAGCFEGLGLEITVCDLKDAFGHDSIPLFSTMPSSSPAFPDLQVRRARWCRCTPLSAESHLSGKETRGDYSGHPPSCRLLLVHPVCRKTVRALKIRLDPFRSRHSQVAAAFSPSYCQHARICRQHALRRRANCQLANFLLQTAGLRSGPR